MKIQRQETESRLFSVREVSRVKKLKITLALSHYDRHIPFFDGTLPAPEKLDIRSLQVGQSVPLKDGADRHERMIVHGEFDAAEVSLSSYIMAKDRGMPLTAIPVFPRRLFSQSQMWVLADSGIMSPADLVGRRVGLSTFQTTLSVLAKGDMKWEYGVPWEKIKWYVNRDETVSFRLKEGVSLGKKGEGKKIGQMLLDGEIDALIMPHPPRIVLEAGARVRRLFPDAKAEELRYYQKNGYYPIMHILALKQELVDREPWVAKALLSLFEEAKNICRGYYDDPNWSQLAWGRHYFEEERALVGDDPWPLGIRRNRTNLERFLEYSLDQGLIDRKMAVDDLFAAPIVACSRK
jgi:4,5-dihydroxyphthalate decarboxylase